MTRQHADRTAFRCAVAPENAAAKLKIGFSKYDVAVLDTSRSGFSVKMPTKIAKKIREGDQCVLLYNDEVWEVQKEAQFASGKKSVNVGFSKVSDLTKIETPKGSIVASNKGFSAADPSFLMYLMLAFIFVCLAMPGLGDNLGTAPKIRFGIQTIWEIITDFSPF